MTNAAADAPKEPPGRWDLWLLGIGVAVLLIVWLVDPLFDRPLPVRPPRKGSTEAVARVNPPEDWFAGKRGNLFQERIVATTTYDKGGVTFDLPEEKQRLRAWVSANDHRDTLLKDPLAISAYHALQKDKGGRLSPHLKWFPHKVEADPKDGSRYELPYSKSALPRFERSHLHRYVVPLFTMDELDKGPAVMKRPLIEYVPVNMHERGFTLEDLDLTRCRAGSSQDDSPALFYKIKLPSRAAYGAFSEEYIGYECAIIVDGYVISAPYFHSRISEAGQINMRTQAEVQALVQKIRALLPGR